MRFASRARLIGIFGIVIALALMFAVNTNLKSKLSAAQAANPAAAKQSIWEYTTTLNIPEPKAPPRTPPFLAIELPTMLTVTLVGVGLALAGLALVIRNPQRRGIAAYMSSLIGITYLMLLVWAVAGSSVDLTDTLARVIRLATPLAIGALAGLICERSGIINIGIEGMMLTAACAGYIGVLLGEQLFGGGQPAVWLGVVIAILMGGLMAALHASLSIRFKIDQIISGTVINIMAVGLTGYIRSNFLTNAKPASKGLPDMPLPLLSEIPLVGSILFNHKPITYLMLILVVVLHFLLFRTVWGLRTRAIGEHPKAADTVGIKVNQMRFRNVVYSGMLAGLGGAWFSLEASGLRFDDFMTNGAGFIALAAMIFGKWTPWGAFGGALLFSSANALQLKVQTFNFALPTEFLQMLPYVVTIIVLAGVIGRARPPAAIGQPYDH